MSLTQEQIKKLAENLSKIHINDEKLKDIEGDLNNILKYFDLLDEVNTDGIKPTYSVIEKENNTLRDDKIEENKASNSKELLNCSQQDIIAEQIAINNIMK